MIWRRKRETGKQDKRRKYVVYLWIKMKKISKSSKGYHEENIYRKRKSQERRKSANWKEEREN